MSTPLQKNPNLIRISVDNNSNFDQHYTANDVQGENANIQEQHNNLESEGIIDQTPRRSTRKRNPPPMDDYITYLTYGNTEEPTSYIEAVNSNEKNKWLEAIESEHKLLLENNTWSVVADGNNVNKLSTKWIFKKKQDNEGNIKFKARLVARG